MEVLAPVQPRHQLDEADRVDLVDAVRARIVAGLRRVTGHGEDVAHALCVRAEQHRLETVDRRVARREMRDRLDAREPFDRDTHHDPAHPSACTGIVVHVDELRLPRFAHGMRGGEQQLGIRAERRIDLHRDDELSVTQEALQQCRRLRRRDGLEGTALSQEQRAGRRDAVVDRRADRGDLRRRRSAAAADDGCAERACLRRKLPEVLGRCVREHDAPARHAREPDVRQCGQRPPGVRHVRERAECGGRPGAVVGAERRHVQLTRADRRRASRHARERLPVAVERHQRDDGQRRHPADRGDGGFELVEVVEGLDHEEVDTSGLEHARLLGEERRRLGVAERADRPGDEDLPA